MSVHFFTPSKAAGRAIKSVHVSSKGMKSAMPKAAKKVSFKAPKMSKPKAPKAFKPKI